MKTQTWLIISEQGSVKTRKTKPDIGPKEVAMRMNIWLPDALFKKPALEASISVSDTDIPQFQFDTKAVNNIQEAIEQVTGLNFSISVAKDEREPAEYDDEINGAAV